LVAPSQRKGHAQQNAQRQVDFGQPYLIAHDDNENLVGINDYGGEVIQLCDTTCYCSNEKKYIT
jgi:hypothetical protein